MNNGTCSYDTIAQSHTACCYLKLTDGNGAHSLLCCSKAKRQWTLQRRGESFRKNGCDLRPSICSHFWTISTNHATTEERGRIAGRSKRSTKRFVEIETVVWNVEIAENLSQISVKNFVKATPLLKKLLKSWFREIAEILSYSVEKWKIYCQWKKKVVKSNN